MKTKTAVKTAKLLMVLLASLLMLAGCASKPASKDSFEEISKRGYLVVGLDDTFAPMGFRDANNELTGFDVDLAKEVVARMGLELRLQPIDWTMKESELNSKNIDLIWNGYSITEKRKEAVNFSMPYLTNRQVIIVMNDSVIQTKADLAGASIAVQRESSALDAVMADAELAAMIKNQAPVEFDTNLEVFMDLEAGRVDAIVVDEVLADYVISQRNPEDYRYLPEDLGSEEYAVGVRKSDEQLLAKINVILTEMIADGSFGEIKQRWFGEQ